LQQEGQQGLKAVIMQMCRKKFEGNAWKYFKNKLIHTTILNVNWLNSILWSALNQFNELLIQQNLLAL